MHTDFETDVIIILVKPPIHYIVFATPHLRDTFSGKTAARLFFLLLNTQDLAQYFFL